MDTFRLIGLFKQESNLEAVRIQNSPMNFVDANGELMRSIDREAGVSLFMFTR